MSEFYPDKPEVPDTLLECALHLRSNILGLTTDGGSGEHYSLARSKLMANAAIKERLPRFVRTSPDAGSLCVTLSQVASGSGSWATRRQHVHEAFEPLLEFIETQKSAVDAIVAEALTSYNAPAVQVFWTKALERRTVDPEGAVTAASALLEDVCKHILEDSGKDWEPKWTIPKLYAEVSTLLNLAPSQHQEEIFKTILGNCQSVVQSIGSLRNKGGDAHAGGRTRVSFKPRHAALTVNLAGSMALFLIETWQAKNEQDKQP
jgi:hypothetical protein